MLPPRTARSAPASGPGAGAPEPPLLAGSTFDAVKAKVPGTWGEEVPVGKGQVDWKAILQTLEGGGFSGPLVIEREAGHAREADVRTAREQLERLVG